MVGSNTIGLSLFRSGSDYIDRASQQVREQAKAVRNEAYRMMGVDQIKDTQPNHILECNVKLPSINNETIEGVCRLSVYVSPGKVKKFSNRSEAYRFDKPYLAELIEYVLDPRERQAEFDRVYEKVNTVMDPFWRLNKYSGKDLVSFEGMDHLISHYECKMNDRASYLDDGGMGNTDYTNFLQGLNEEERTAFNKSKEQIDNIVTVAKEIIEEFGSENTSKFQELLLSFLKGCRDERADVHSEQADFDSAGTLFMAHLIALISGIKEESVLNDTGDYISALKPLSEKANSIPRLFNEVVSLKKEVNEEGGKIPDGIENDDQMFEWAKKKIERVQAEYNKFLEEYNECYYSLTEDQQKMVKFFRRTLDVNLWSVHTTNRYGLNNTDEYPNNGPFGFYKDIKHKLKYRSKLNPVGIFRTPEQDSVVKKLLWHRSFVHKACNIATIISFPFIREAFDYLVKESLDRIYIRPALESIGAEDPKVCMK